MAESTRISLALAWISQTRASQGGEVAVIGQFSGA
jgi:hypothetical protein